MAMKKVAVLGLGAMGTRVVQNFISEGYDVTVWNRSSQATAALAAKGATVAASPKIAGSLSLP